MTVSRLGLPEGTRGCLFDLDGVLTDTAAAHAQAWARTFDEVLASRPEQQAPFDVRRDYARYVDGLPRLEGVRRFSASRDVQLPEGSPQDEPTAATVHGVGRRKDDLVLRLLEEQGVRVFPGSLAYLHAVRDEGLATAVVSSSANTRAVLETTGLAELLDVRVDALVAEEHGLLGKPAPDTFLHAAARLGLEPRVCAVVEDAVAGVQAGRAGRFARVVGVDRAGQRQLLLSEGADVVVDELDELLA